MTHANSSIVNLFRLPRCIAAAFVYSICLPPALSAGEPPTMNTPNENDIPKPVPADISLAGSDKPDITRFLNMRAASQPSLSPDGGRVAFQSTISGKPQLWVVDAEGGWPSQLTFGESVTFHEWSPTGEWIIYGTDRGGNEREGYYLIRPDGLLERELLPPSDAFRAFGGFTLDGKRVAYGSTERNGVDFDLRLIDVDSGGDRMIFEGRMGLYPVSWSPDASKVILSEARGEDANDVSILDVESGTETVLFKPETAGFYGGFSWKRDGSGFYLVTNQDREYQGLAYYDLSTKALIYLETPDADVENAALSPDGSILVWIINKGGFSVLRARDMTSGDMIETPELPHGVMGFSWARDANIAAVRVSGPRLPGDVWVWNAESNRLTRATRSTSAGLDLSAMIEPEHHEFPARDGVLLRGLLYRPNKTGGGKPPVVLMAHGGPTAQSRPDFNAIAQYLLTRGIAVFELNYRGSTGYGKTFARLNDRRLKAVEYLDLEDAVRWLGKQGFADASRAAVMGGSYGGYLTMTAMARLPETFRCGIAFVGVSNWITGLEGASPQLKASDRLEYGDIDDPEDREFYLELSPITHAGNVKNPVMALHGANDPRCPVTESDMYVQAIRGNGGEVEYLRFPDEGHGIRKLENRIIAYRRIERFLARIFELD